MKSTLTSYLLALTLILITAIDIQGSETSEVHSDQPITRIAFGSCNNPAKKPSPIFDAITKQDPDLFLFMGDNIYGDTTNMKTLKAKYQKLAEVTDFQELKKQTKLIAVWDDHDYGVNDGGKSYPKKVQSQKIFLDFFDEPDDSLRRSRPGLYQSYSFGPIGKRCQILLLDTRYFRDELGKAKKKKTKNFVGWYQPTKNSSLTLLGKDQWDWLENELKKPADVRIIASSIQLIAHEKGMENWGNVPHEQKRLFDLLKKYKANHTVAISGDVHFAELSKKDIGGYPLYDLTSSGITHTHPAWAAANNSFRIGQPFDQRNAGVIDIDWSNKSLTLGVLDRQSKLVLQHKVNFSELEFPSAP